MQEYNFFQDEKYLPHLFITIRQLPFSPPLVTAHTCRIIERKTQQYNPRESYDDVALPRSALSCMIFFDYPRNIMYFCTS